MFIIARKHITPRTMLYRTRIVVESCSYRNCNRPISRAFLDEVNCFRRGHFRPTRRRVCWLNLPAAKHACRRTGMSIQATVHRQHLLLLLLLLHAVFASTVQLDLLRVSVQSSMIPATTKDMATGKDRQTDTQA